MDKEIALKNIKLFQKIVPRSCAVYGTCLGLLREGGIINHDLDTDMGIMINDFDYKIVNDLIKNGFMLRKVFGMPSCGMEMAFFKDGVKTDLMIFYKLDGRIFNCLWDNGGKKLSDMIVHSYDKSLFNLYEETDGVRHLTRKYIEHVYGPEWRTPTSPWNWRTDHKCIDQNLKNKILINYV